MMTALKKNPSHSGYVTYKFLTETNLTLFDEILWQYS